MAAVQHPKSAPSYFHSRNTSNGLNTLPDPRTPSPSIGHRNGSAESGVQHPDLSNEVATLSTKLINAINHQTNLDDSLQSARAELEAAREEITRLKASNEEHLKLKDQGHYVSRIEYDRMVEQLNKELNTERTSRLNMEKEKKKIEGELENLSMALFEEANQMVAAARKETEASEIRNKQLRSQINDTELLLASHQEQLQDLKAVMEKMESERDENESNPQGSTAPSTPALDKMNRMFEGSMASPYTPGNMVNPEHPLHFENLIQPVFRTDIQAYDDFRLLFRSRGSAPSRTPSGNYGSLLGLTSTNTNSSSTNLSQLAGGQQGHSPKNSSRPPTSSGPAATSQTAPGFTSDANLPPLKDTKFYKRILTEDIEPTLRLDLAPSLSFFNRRSLLSGLASGSLAIEPFSAPTVNYGPAPLFPCSLCGEKRKGDKYVRKWRMRANDEDGAQRWALCEWCCTRVRSTAELAGFLRCVQRGVWRSTNHGRRASTDGSQVSKEIEEQDTNKEAWEECTSLRERMFWARVGGGVIPAVHHGDKSMSAIKEIDSPMVGQADGAREKDDSVKDKGSTDEIRSMKDTDSDVVLLSHDADEKKDDPFAAAVSASSPLHRRKKSSVSERPLPIPHRQSTSSGVGNSSTSIPLAHNIIPSLPSETAEPKASPKIELTKEPEADAEAANAQLKSEEAEARARAVAARIRLFNEKEKGLGMGTRTEWQKGKLEMPKREHPLGQFQIRNVSGSVGLGVKDEERRGRSQERSEEKTAEPENVDEKEMEQDEERERLEEVETPTTDSVPEKEADQKTPEEEKRGSLGIPGSFD
ncbi:MAG: rab guanine nucleotide exchange factor S2 [Bogoriella megaspora]|nr:MAG: rab guanine nucleotide exchange factor S2 [Bogoriella megaspora]